MQRFDFGCFTSILRDHLCPCLEMSQNDFLSDLLAAYLNCIMKQVYT